MKLHTYGCSWTEGLGANTDIENKLEKKEKKLFRNKHSWPNFIAEKLNVEVINNGISSNSNNKIFNQIVEDIQSEKIIEGDLVIIMWSSSLRDYLPFLPNNEWLSWSTNHLLKSPDRFINSYMSKSIIYNNFLINFKNFFVRDLFNQNYYNIVNQNYIIFLQSLFLHFKIRYFMCDAFEPMIISLDKKDDKIDFINTEFYWGFNKKTFRDFLNDTNRLDIWEHQDATFKTRETQHPNYEGYKLIGAELYNHIKYYVSK